MRDILGDSSIVDGLHQALMAGTTPNGVFGGKVHWGHFRFLGLLKNGEWSEARRTEMYDLMRSQLPCLLPQAAAFELLNAHFPDLSPHNTAYALLRSQLPDLRVIWLRRRNMVARAISLYRARQTGIWYRSTGNSGANQGEHAPEFDLGEIHTLYCLAAFQEERWRQFFQEHKISPHCVLYEELVADYESTVRGVLNFLEIGNAEVAIPSPASAKQSDGASENWEQLYRKAVSEADT